MLSAVHPLPSGRCGRTLHVVLRGRDAELGRLASCLRARRHAVLIGDAGVGKTALWNAALGDARVAGDRVVRCVATQAAASVPLAALAPLLDGSSAAQPPLERILLALDGLRRADGGNVVLGIDDAHQLDEASAAAVRAAAETERATLLLTVREASTPPDAIVGLWKDDLADLVTVRALGPADAAAMIADLVDGDVDAGTAVRMIAVAGGNALFLRELVAHGRDTGALASVAGLWTWQGELRPGPRLGDVVAARLDALDPDERYTAELVASAEPVPLHALTAVVAREPLARLERAGIVIAEQSQRRVLVRCAHPLHAATLRERAPQSAVRAGLAVLADALEASGAKRADDPLLIGQWLLDAGRAPRVELLSIAARRAHAHGHVLLAERLARAAIDAGAGDEARMVLHQTLIWQARIAEADAVVPSVDDPDERARTLLAGSRVDAFLVGAEDVRSVRAALDAAAQSVTEPALRAELGARRSGLELAAGGHTAAATDPWDARGDAPAVVVVRLAFGAVPALAAAGRTADALEAAEIGNDAHKALAEPMTFATEQLAASTGFALLLAGDLDRADSCVLGAYDAAVSGGDRFAQALMAVPAAELDLWRGRVRSAARRAAEALALTNGIDRMGFRPWAAGLRAHAAAWLGERDAARFADAEPDAWPPAGQFLHSFSRLAYARARLLLGEPSRAARLARDLADVARAREQPTVAALALHTAATAGDARDVAPRLRDLATATDGALVPLLLAHVDAMAVRDALDLERVADRAVDAGLVPIAIDAAARALAIHTADRRRADSARVAATVRRLQRSLEAPMPLPFASAAAPTLTRREREVAALASRGLTNNAIARELTLSVRTVHTHLQAAYAKLGTSDRTALAAALADQEP